MFEGAGDQLGSNLYHGLLLVLHNHCKPEPKGPLSKSAPETDTVASPNSQHCALSVYRLVGAVLYTPPGVTLLEYLYPPYPTSEIFRMALFQFQIAVADVIQVLSTTAQKVLRAH